MNEIANKFSLAGDKPMHEMHSKQPRFTYNACVLEIFFVIVDPIVFLLLINFLVSDGICSSPKLSK